MRRRRAHREDRWFVPNLDIISFNMHGGAPVGIRHFLATFIRAFYITKDMDKLTRQLNAGLEAIGTERFGGF